MGGCNSQRKKVDKLCEPHVSLWGVHFISGMVRYIYIRVLIGSTHIGYLSSSASPPQKYTSCVGLQFPGMPGSARKSLNEYGTVLWFYRTTIGYRWVLTKKPSSSRPYNHGKKWLTHFVWFRRKKKPLSPNVMLIRVMLSEALPDPPTLIWWRWGRIMIKGENLCFLLNNVMPHFYFSGKHGDSFIASDVPTIFFHDCRWSLSQWKCVFVMDEPTEVRHALSSL